MMLQTVDSGYSIKPGDVFNWADTFCVQMVDGRGPMMAPRSADVPEYVSARIGQQVPIGAYIGVPLTKEDGSLFGTLCAIDPTPQPADISSELPTVQLLASLLSMLSRLKFMSRMKPGNLTQI